jgi:hypothetical protein
MMLRAMADATHGHFPDEVPTPVGMVCPECGRRIEEGDRGHVMESTQQVGAPGTKPVAYHEECLAAENL